MGSLKNYLTINYFNKKKSQSIVIKVSNFK